MPALHAANVALSMVVQIPQEVFDRHLPSSPQVVGKLLAQAVAQYSETQQLGYFPALDFFQEQGDMDPELLNAAENIAWLGTSLVREEVQIRLRGVFASVNIRAIQCLAFTMPTVRPQAPDALERLAKHYTPNQVKLDLLVTTFRKQKGEAGMDKMAKQMAHRWLKDSFAQLEISNATLV